jgi:hypothetical protein
MAAIPDPVFTVKDWKDFPDRTTALTAQAMKDMEKRLSQYTVDFVTKNGGGGPAAQQYIDLYADYGVQGSDSAHDSAAIGEAILETSTNPNKKVMLLRSGEYEFNWDWLTGNGLATNIPIRLVGLGSDSTRIYHNAPGQRLIRNVGSWDYLGVNTSDPLASLRGPKFTAPAAIGETVINVPTAGLVAGDMIQIRDEGSPFIARWNGSQLGVAGQTVTIANIISSSQLELRGACRHAYTTTATIRKMVPVDGQFISGITSRSQ